MEAAAAALGLRRWRRRGGEGGRRRVTGRRGRPRQGRADSGGACLTAGGEGRARRGREGALRQVPAWEASSPQP